MSYIDYYGISFAAVQQILGTTARDLKALCTHVNINKWSRCKPIPGRGEFNPYPGDWGMGLDDNNPFALSVKKILQYSDWNTEEYTYLRPTGGAASPYRLHDFGGYLHTAKSPFVSSLPDKFYLKKTNMIEPRLIASGYGNSFNPGGILANELPIGMHLGIALRFPNSDEPSAWFIQTQDAATQFEGLVVALLEGYRGAYGASSMYDVLGLGVGTKGDVVEALLFLSDTAIGAWYYPSSGPRRRIWAYASSVSGAGVQLFKWPHADGYKRYEGASLDKTSQSTGLPDKYYMINGGASKTLSNLSTLNSILIPTTIVGGSYGTPSHPTNPSITVTSFWGIRQMLISGSEGVTIYRTGNTYTVTGALSAICRRPDFTSLPPTASELIANGGGMGASITIEGIQGQYNISVIP